MRTKKAINNIVYGVGSSLVNNLFGFISRTVFIYTLGATYLGVNGLFTNILFMLSMAELGIGTAIGFSLYKPLAIRDFHKISILMSFYKRAYRIIGCIVTILGLVLLFFLNHFIKNAETIPNLRIIFLLYLANSVFIYFISYKNTLISADQMGYKLIPLQTLLSILSTLILIIVLLIFKHFIIYLSLQILLSMISQIILNYAITKRYTEVNFNNTEKLSEEEYATIKTNVKALVFHRIGEYCQNGTDNIVISAFVSIVSVGIYSNYTMLIFILNKYVMIVLNGVQASFGNLLATESVEKKYTTFKTFNLLGFWLFSWLSICFYNLLTPFVILWIGHKYTVSNYVIIPVIINYYLKGMRIPLSILKTAGGVYNQDKYSPLVQSAVNLSFSIYLVQRIGLAGVFWGTVISCIVPLITSPYVTYKYIFLRSSIEYFVLYTKYLFIFLLSIFFTTALCYYLLNGSSWLFLIGKTIICIVIPNIMFYLIFKNKAEMKHIRTILESLDLLRWRFKFNKSAS